MSNLSDFLIPPNNIEINNKDIVLRRVHRKNDIDENGDVRFHVFLLRAKLPNSGQPEKDISVVVHKLGAPPINVEKFKYCALKASKVRRLMVGVTHTPSNGNINHPHGSLHGFFDVDKATALSKIADVLEPKELTTSYSKQPYH